MSLVRFRAQNHPQQAIKDAVDDRGTDPDVFAEYDREYGPFTLDVAAAPHNAKCERYFTIDENALTQPWGGERVWCNPPYSGIGDWTQKAWLEAEWADIIVMLLPANRTEQRWWQRDVEPFRDKPGGLLSVQFLPGRMRFIRPGSTLIGPNERPPFGCCLLVWRPI